MYGNTSQYVKLSCGGGPTPSTDRYIYRAVEGQTVFNCDYTNAGQNAPLDVWINGAKVLQDQDYSADSGNNIILYQPCKQGDEIVIFYNLKASRYSYIVEDEAIVTYPCTYTNPGTNPDIDVFVDDIMMTAGEEYTAISGTDITFKRYLTLVTAIHIISSTGTKRSVHKLTGGETNFDCTYTNPGTNPDLDVYLNSVKETVNGEFVATTGTNISLNTPAVDNDILHITTYNKVAREVKRPCIKSTLADIDTPLGVPQLDVNERFF